jgi:hypothetical protein
MRDSSFSGWKVAGRRALITCFAALAGASALDAQDGWFRIQTPHFTILSSASESQARAWATDLEQFTRAMAIGFPAAAADLSPVTVVIFKRDADFQPFKPLDRDKPAAVSGLFARTPFADVIGLDGEAKGVDVRRTVLHEAVHWLFSRRTRPLPIWLEEGIAEVYSTLRFTDPSHAVIGDPILGHAYLLRRGLGLPLAQVFDATRGYFYAESWLMVHYALFASGSDRGATLDRYLEILNEGHSQSEAMRFSFGSDYGEIQRELDAYLRNGRYRVGLITLPHGGVRPEQFLVDRPRPGELELALGGLLTVTRTPAEAAAHLQVAAREAPGNPKVWEELGDTALLGHDSSAAAGYFQQAVATGSANYLAYFHLAMLSEHPQDRAAAPAALAAARELLRRAIDLRPDFLPAYQNLAVMIYSEDRADPRDGELMASGLKLDPKDPTIALGAAAAELKGADRAKGRQALVQLLATLPATAPPRVAVLGRMILKAEALRDLNQRIAELSAQRQFGAAAAAIDAAMAGGAEFDGATRSQLAAVRQRALDLQSLADAQRLAGAGDLIRARDLLEKLAGDLQAAADVRQQAQDQLARLPGAPGQPAPAGENH